MDNIQGIDVLSVRNLLAESVQALGIVVTLLAMIAALASLILAASDFGEAVQLHVWMAKSLARTVAKLVRPRRAMSSR